MEAQQVSMYTILWRENDEDRWERVQTEEEVSDLVIEIAKTQGVAVDEAEVMILSPEADEYAISVDDIFEDVGVVVSKIEDDDEDEEDEEDAFRKRGFYEHDEDEDPFSDSDY